MILVDHLVAVWRDARQRFVHYLLSHRIRARNPTLTCDPTVIWDYPVRRPDAIEIGIGVSVMPNCEIVVQPKSHFSSVEGRLVLGDGAVLSTGTNIRAGGGVVKLGAGSVIAQHSVVVAANHKAMRGVPYLRHPLDESRTGVFVGDNVWVGANCTLLPGTRIGDNALVAAGSVVRGVVPPNQIWGGVPARFIKDVPERDDA